MICMCRVHKTFVLFIPRNSRMSSSKSTALLGSMSFPKFKEKNVIPKVNSIVAFDVTLTPVWSPKSTARLGSMSPSHPLAHPKSMASAGSMSPSYPLLAPQSQRHRWLQCHPRSLCPPKVNGTVKFNLTPSLPPK